MADRYEARLLPPVGEAPALWGAWDLERGDWLRQPGPSRREEWFTSAEQVRFWMEKWAESSQSYAPAVGGQYEIGGLDRSPGGVVAGALDEPGRNAGGEAEVASLLTGELM